jgi:hypothetical protein
MALKRHRPRILLHTIVLLQTGVTFWCLIFAFEPASAQTNAKAEKWRPKDGVYAGPGKDFVADCGEGQGYIEIEVSKRHVGGNEWGCKVTKVTDTAPGAIRLDMTCNNYNLAESIKAPEDKEFKEIALLKKIDENTILVRQTLNGKFGDSHSWWRAAYCPDDMQRMHAGIQPEPWLPRDGVYASPGPDFDDRCSKSPDAVVDLAGKHISSGADRCEIFSRIDPGPGDSLMTATCNETVSAKRDVVVKYIDNWPMVGPPGFEIMKLERIDDNTISLQKTHDGKSSAPARQVSYCGNEAQRAYREAREKEKSTEPEAAEQPTQTKP